MKEYMEKYYMEFTQHYLPFWLEHGWDRANGGYYTCLDRKGNVYSKDKSVWFQGRFIYVLSLAIDILGNNDLWLEAAESGAQFMLNNCFDSDGRMFFRVTEDGRPVQKRRYLFSETFAITGLAQYAKISGKQEYLEKAKNIFTFICKILKTPNSLPEKYYSETRQMKSHSIRMIMLSVAQCLRDIEGTTGYDIMIEEIITELLNDFLKPDLKAMLENTGPNGEFVEDFFEGGIVNPGHAIETSWFIMEEGRKRNDKNLIESALNILDWSLMRGWDEKYGGIYAFADVLDRQPVQLEWDMKLWWPQTEALYAVLLAWKLTGDTKYKEWHKKIDDYVFTHFPDREYGSWFGYLHRDGSISHNYKGNLWMGPYHIPRALLLSYKLLME